MASVDPIAHGLSADATTLLSINVVLWLLSLRLRKTWPVDFIWSTWPLLMCAQIICREPEQGRRTRQLVICLLVALWGGRLTLNFVLRGGIGHEDWRYTAMRSQFGAHFWWVSLFSVFLGQSVFMFAACVSLYGALLCNRPGCSSADLLAALLCVAGILLELLADRQMDAFQALKRARRTEALVIERGLWLCSRHPNYFGELLWWWGVWLLGAHSAPWWVVSGPVAITLLFQFISVPLMEDRQLQSKGFAFRAYRRRVRSSLLPLPPSVRRVLLPPTPQLALVGLDNAGKTTLAQVRSKPTQPNPAQTKPNPTKPNRTQPNQTPSAGAAADSSPSAPPAARGGPHRSPLGVAPRRPHVGGRRLGMPAPLCGLGARDQPGGRRRADRARAAALGSELARRSVCVGLAGGGGRGGRVRLRPRRARPGTHGGVSRPV